MVRRPFVVPHNSWIMLGASDLPAHAPVLTHAAADRYKIHSARGI